MKNALKDMVKKSNVRDEKYRNCKEKTETIENVGLRAQKIKRGSNKL